MGNQRQFNPDGGFYQYLFQSHPDWEKFSVNDLKAKVVRMISDPECHHPRLPAYSNTSDVYLLADDHGAIIQARVYVNRQSCLDFDWDHSHCNTEGDKQFFPAGVVHVQSYAVDEKGRLMRLSMQARLMTDDEIAKYGPIIHHFNPDVKFRP